MSSIYELLGVPSSGFDVGQFVESWLLPAYALGVLRCLLSIYCFSTIFYSWAWFATHKVVFHLQDIDVKEVTFVVGSEGIRQSFSYFTYLSYWGLAFYLGFAGIHSLIFAFRSDRWLTSWPRPLQALHSVFYSSIVCLPFLVSAVYWASMWVGPWFDHDFDAWSNTSIHIMNSAFATVEILLPRTQPLPWSHLPILLMIATLYLGVAYITKLTEGVYIYLWLDPKVGAKNIVAHVVGYAMIIVVSFNVVRGAIIFRQRITNGKKQMSSTRRLSSHGSDREVLWRSPDLELQNESWKKRSVDMESIDGSIHWSRPGTSGSLAASFMTMVPLPPEPEEVHHSPYPSRSSSFHARNLPRPDSLSNLSTRPGAIWA